MRDLALAAALLALAACNATPPPATTSQTTTPAPQTVAVDSTPTISCDGLDAHRSAISGLRIIADAHINTTDPTEVARMQRLQADARQQIAEEERWVARCDAASGTQ